MTTTITPGQIAARRMVVNQLADLIRADHTITAEDTRLIANAVDGDDDPAYFGPGEPVWGYLLAASQLLGESGYDLMQSVELALGW